MIVTSPELVDSCIKAIVNQLRKQPFEVTYEVKDHPKGIKVIFEITKEEEDFLIKQNILKA